MEYKFKIGDMVLIVRSGYGITDHGLGKTVKIVGTGVYNDQPGYKIDHLTNPAFLSNSLSGAFDGFCGEDSFILNKDFKKEINKTKLLISKFKTIYSDDT
jgi:hypothetical protein